MVKWLNGQEQEQQQESPFCKIREFSRTKKMALEKVHCTIPQLGRDGQCKNAKYWRDWKVFPSTFVYVNVPTIVPIHISSSWETAAAAATLCALLQSTPAAAMRMRRRDGQ